MQLNSIEVTDNFAENLASIESFLHDAKADSAYDKLIAELTGSVIPNLKRFPRFGRPFLQELERAPEAALLLPTLQAKLRELDFGDELREYLMRHYLILYTFNSETGYLLSIKHHRQLAFEFTSLWEAGDYPPNQSVRGKLLLQQERAKYELK